MKPSALIAQSCQTICDPMDCNPPGSSVHGILQARILEWVVIPFFRGIFLTQRSNPGILHCRQILYHLNHQRSPEYNDTSSLKKMQNRTSNFSPQI